MTHSETNGQPDSSASLSLGAAVTEHTISLGINKSGIAPSSHASAVARREFLQQVFSSAGGPEVFRSVCHRHEIWREDPFDVPSIHEHARSAFADVLAQTLRADEATAGRILLILGESGAGKTHLMRVIRNQVHSEAQGYCGYLQMTSAANDYGRYVLCNLIDSLDQSYCESAGPTSGLQLLSNSLVEIPSSILKQERDALREDRFVDARLADFVRELADLIIEDERFAACDVHLIQALLYLQRNEPRSKSRVLSYLRCEPMSPADCEIIGGLVPRTDADRTIEQVGRLMWCLERKALVICVDQLEDMANLDRDAERFRRAITAVCSLAERVPSSLFVISCLEDLYPPLKESLTRSYLDRIEHDPEPVRLESCRSYPELVDLVSRRLDVLFQNSKTTVDPDDPTYPFPQKHLRALTHARTRDILDWCRNYQKQVIRGDVVAGAVIESDEANGPNHDGVTAEAVRPSDAETETIRLTQLWNDALAAHTAATSDDDEVLAEQLTTATLQALQELPNTQEITAHRDGTHIELQGLPQVSETSGSGEAVACLLAVCNRSPQGGALSRQVQKVLKALGSRCPIIVRSTEFPAGGRTKIAQQLLQVQQLGGRCIVVEDSDWRAMRTMVDFQRIHGQDEHFDHWLQLERPLTRLKSMRQLLNLPSEAPANEQPLRRAA